MHARTDRTGQPNQFREVPESVRQSVRADLQAEVPESVRQCVRADLQAADQTGAPPLGHLAGLRRRDIRDDARGTGGYSLELDPARPALAGGAGVLEFAMLADLALGGVIRNQVGLVLPMPTVSMTVQFAPGRTREVLWADGQCTVQLERTATARSQLFTAAGEVVGDAVGVFALPKLPYEGPGRAMPWDLAHNTERQQEQVHADEQVEPLSPDQEALVGSIQRHADGDPAWAWGSEHVAEQLKCAAGRFALAPTSPMVNRLGHVQGGVLFAAAVLAAARMAEFPVETLTTATIEFIEVADLDGPLVPEVTVLRASGRSLFTSTVVVQDGRPRSHASAVFRR